MPLCHIRQFRISSAIDDGREISRSLSSHLDSCPACQQFLQKHRALESNLKATPAPSESPDWLHTKIMAKVNHAEPDLHAPNRWLPATAGIAAIGIVFAIVATNVQPPSDDPQPTVVDLPAPTTPIHPASVTSSIERHTKRALGKEFRDIATDISGARNFLSASLRNTIPGMREEE